MLNLESRFLSVYIYSAGGALLTMGFSKSPRTNLDKRKLVHIICTN